MYKTLRIIFCIIAVVLTAVCVFVFIYADGLGWGFLCVALAVVCYFLMVFFKKKQEQQEGIENPPAPEGDFITGRITADNAMERVAAINSAVTVEQDGQPRTFILTKGNKESFDKVGVQSPLGKAVWHKKIGDELTVKNTDCTEYTVTITNIE
ncbi:MAG: GreA/GreB family elongation factor [Clostridia bacterium]|nr:GreA/GreB family elongation factor [Clostridia bacterium]